jgi:hypothetical protein
MVDPTSEATSVQTRTRVTFLEEEEEEEEERKEGSEDESMENDPKDPQFREEEEEEGEFTSLVVKEMRLNQNCTEIHPYDHSTDMLEQTAPCEIDPDSHLPQIPSPSHSPASRSTSQSRDKAMNIDTPEGRKPNHLNTKVNHDQGATNLQVTPRRSSRNRRSTSGGNQKQDISAPQNPHKRMSKTRPANNSRPKQSATKKEVAAIMEETAAGDIRERILIDLTINDLQADMVSTTVVYLRNASSGVTGRAPAKVVERG